MASLYPAKQEQLSMHHNYKGSALFLTIVSQHFTFKTVFHSPKCQKIMSKTLLFIFLLIN